MSFGGQHTVHDVQNVRIVIDEENAGQGMDLVSFGIRPCGESYYYSERFMN
jgi:hypothetical protein